MQETLLGVPVEMIAAICIAVAALYAVYWPKPGPGVERVQWRAFVLRWFHAMTWVGLALATLAFKYLGQTPAQVLGVIALLVYLTFMATLLTDRRKRPSS